MLNYYHELLLLLQEEIPIHFLWSKVFQQIHLGLVEMQDEQGRVPIGLSFPEYITGEKYSVLGSKCRLFAQDEATLARFNAAKWLARLSDYVHCTSIRPVPEKIMGYAIYQREQPKTNKERLARRYAKRHNVNYETALERYSEMAQQTITTPFIRLKSLSGGNEFCLWIKKTIVAEASGATFSSYGLSAVSSVPEF
ncbi:type I-F CRISPR-associated endoribonuclease Cas6/Csy4 [Methylovulum sp.]|uniref:type I-F CRISPR-associated endoribonuclease Cas6/Csy4 n=1 Tax=Methylovulum sp. TaxID=1916980 RepID=UPI0026267DF2|nr:type I-F CRISPR-associated endoribonuclease Cas6/Csy4 [Methylovulum sp.]MDD5125647.1 type I-F CRISPR-associated endoribonuclease Cas6/Csy4 [Methylovulum sp.]